MDKLCAVALVLADRLQKLNGPTKQGIFRLSGDAQNMKIFRQTLDEHLSGGKTSMHVLDVIQNGGFSVFDLACCLKHVTSLFAPKLLDVQTDRWLQLFADGSAGEREAFVVGLLHDLSPEYRLALCVCVQLFADVAAHADTTLMDASDVAKVVAPNFWSTPEAPHEQHAIVDSLNARIAAVHWLIEHSALFQASLSTASLRFAIETSASPSDGDALVWVYPRQEEAQAKFFARFTDLPVAATAAAPDLSKVVYKIQSSRAISLSSCLRIVLVNPDDPLRCIPLATTRTKGDMASALATLSWIRTVTDMSELNALAPAEIYQRVLHGFDFTATQLTSPNILHQSPPVDLDQPHLSMLADSLSTASSDLASCLFTTSSPLSDSSNSSSSNSQSSNSQSSNSQSSDCSSSNNQSDSSSSNNQSSNSQSNNQSPSMAISIPSPSGASSSSGLAVPSPSYLSCSPGSSTSPLSSSPVPRQSIPRKVVFVGSQPPAAHGRPLFHWLLSKERIVGQPEDSTTGVFGTQFLVDSMVVSCWNTDGSGDPSTAQTRHSLYGGAHLVVICYQPEYLQSFFDADMIWFAELERLNVLTSARVVLCAALQDGADELITREEGIALAQSLNVNFCAIEERDARPLQQLVKAWALYRSIDLADAAQLPAEPQDLLDSTEHLQYEPVPSELLAAVSEYIAANPELEITRSRNVDKNGAMVFVGQPRSGKTALQALLFGGELTSAVLRSGEHRMVVSCLGQNLVAVDTSASLQFARDTSADDIDVLRCFVTETGYEAHLFVFSWRFTHLDAFPHQSLLDLHAAFPDAKIVVVVTFGNVSSLPTPDGPAPAFSGWGMSPKQARWQAWRTLHLQDIRRRAGGDRSIAWLSTCVVDNDPLCDVNAQGKRCLLNNIEWIPPLVGLVVASGKDFTWKDMHDALSRAKDKEVVDAGNIHVQRRLKRFLQGTLASHGPVLVNQGALQMIAAQSDRASPAIAVGGIVVAAGAMVAAAPVLAVGGLVVAASAAAWKGYTKLIRDADADDTTLSQS